MKILFAAVFLISFAANAQTFSSPIKEGDDAATQTLKLKALAMKMLHLRSDDSAATYNSLAYYALTSGDFTQVPALLDKASFYRYGDTLPRAWMAPYRMYAEVMAAAPANFNDAYQRKIEQTYDAMNDDNQSWFLEYFGYYSADAATAAWLSVKQDAAKADTISKARADNLIKAYDYYLVYNSIYSTGKAFADKKSNERYIIEDSVAVVRPGGIIIPLTIVRLRRVSTPMPVVLSYNIYAGNDVVRCKDAADRGYVGVIANTRGKRFSPQETEPFEHDADDAYDIIDWISRQPWCNGKVGMWGGSYLGFSQWATLKHPHPALKTVVPQVSVGAGIDFPYSNGVPMTYMLLWLHYVTDNKTTASAYFNDDLSWGKIVQQWFQSGRSFRALDSIEGRPDKLFQRWLDHPLYDDYWKKTTPQKNEFSKINIPILTTTGYWDDDQFGAQWYYRQYMKYNSNPNYYLLIGPWDHAGSQYRAKPTLLGYRIDSVANISIADVVFKWFDHVMKDSSMPAILQDRVNFEMPGMNRWLHAPSLEKMTNDTLRFYIGPQTETRHYRLASRRGNYAAEQVVDLRDRNVPHLYTDDVEGFESLVRDSLQPAADELVLTSDPFENETLLSGNFTADLRFIINKKDADFTMRFFEQTPDGKFFSLTEALQRASLAADREKRMLLKPGVPQSLAFCNTFILARKFSKGSRLVMLLGINKNDDWEINYGTGKDVNSETIADAGEPVHITWLPETELKMPILRL